MVSPLSASRIFSVIISFISFSENLPMRRGLSWLAVGVAYLVAAAPHQPCIVHYVICKCMDWCATSTATNCLSIYNPQWVCIVLTSDDTMVRLQSLILTVGLYRLLQRITKTLSEANYLSDSFPFVLLYFPFPYFPFTFFISYPFHLYSYVPFPPFPSLPRDLGHNTAQPHWTKVRCITSGTLLKFESVCIFCQR